MYLKNFLSKMILFTCNTCMTYQPEFLPQLELTVIYVSHGRARETFHKIFFYYSTF